MILILLWIFVYFMLGVIFYVVELYNCYDQFRNDTDQNENYKKDRYEINKSCAFEVLYIWPIYLFVLVGPYIQRLFSSFAEKIWNLLHKPK